MKKHLLLNFLVGCLLLVGMEFAHADNPGHLPPKSILANPNSTPGNAVPFQLGAIFAHSIRMSDDATTDNARFVTALNLAMNGIPGSIHGLPVFFMANPTNARGYSSYYFSNTLDVTEEGTINCGDGSRVGLTPRVSLVFAPGVPGVRFDNPANAQTGNGTRQANINGCHIVSLGFALSRIYPTVGNPTISTPAFQNEAYAPTATRISVGDALAVFSMYNYVAGFSGGITGKLLTVTSVVDSPADLVAGMMIQGNNIPNGIYIGGSGTTGATCGGSACTGTGGAGTYLLTYSIASPPLASQANTGTLTGSFNGVTPSGPIVTPGTTVRSCTGGPGSLCGPYNGGSNTLTLSNAPTEAEYFVVWLLPGPNTTLPAGSQMYNITTSLTGRTYPALTGGISNGSGGSGAIMNITSGGASLNVGQTVIGVGGGTVSTTTTSALTVGEYQSIPVGSCSGISAGMYVVGFASGNQVFPPGTTVASCTSGLLAVNLQNHNNFGGTTSGSNQIYVESYYTGPPAMWTGLPVSGANIPAGTTVQSWSLAPGDSTTLLINLSNSATSTVNVPPSETINFGGAMYAASSGMTLTFLNGSDTIMGLGTGTGGKGTYTLSSKYNLTAGSTLYAYDTPSTIYVTGGPRSLRPQDLLWSDAFAFGTIAQKVYGTSPTRQTMIASNTMAYQPVAAKVAHASGAGQMWVLPTGLTRTQSGTSYGNWIDGFPVGLNMACHGGYWPISGCGRSTDSQNFFSNGLIGRLTIGNNAGGSSSIANEYDHNYFCDICELATVGSTYIAEQLQGQDESSSTQVLLMNCADNGSTFTGIYASGAATEATCLPYNVGNLDAIPLGGFQTGPVWFGAVWGQPYDSASPMYGNGLNCSGTPTSSFAVTNGIVTHC